MLYEFLRRRVGKQALRRLRRREFRPQVDRLEDRFLPATSTWQPAGLTATGDWNQATNWGGVLPKPADTALFNLIAAAPTLSKAVTIANLTIQAKQAGAPAPWTTTINLAGHNLTVSGLTNVYSAAMGGGAIRPGQAGQAVLDMQSTGAKATLSTDSLKVGYEGALPGRRRCRGTWLR